MSTKIWTAYRLRKGHDLWETLRDIRLRATKNVRTDLTKFYNELVDVWKQHPEKWKEAYKVANQGAVPTDKHKPGYYTASRLVHHHYKSQVGELTRDIFDLDVSIAVRKYKSQYLMIPYPGSGILSGTLNFLKNHKALEDFHFQNSTDKSAKCTDREWRQRGKIWDYLIDDDRFSDFLALDIVSVMGFWRVDPTWDLIKRNAKSRVDGKVNGELWLAGQQGQSA